MFTVEEIKEAAVAKAEAEKARLRQAFGNPPPEDRTASRLAEAAE